MFRTIFCFLPTVLLLFPMGSRAQTAQGSKVPTAHRILILGDSLTEGYGISKGDAFPALLETLLNQKSKTSTKRYQVVAAGSSGSTTASAHKRLRWHLRKKPILLILALGANDGLRGVKPSATKENLDKAIVFAKSKNIKVLLAGMKIPMNYGADYRKAFEKTFTDLAQKHKVDFLPFLLKDVGGVTSLNQSDGIHPNEKGHKIIAENLFKKLKGVL